MCVCVVLRVQAATCANVRATRKFLSGAEQRRRPARSAMEERWKRALPTQVARDRIRSNAQSHIISASELDRDARDRESKLRRMLRRKHTANLWIKLCSFRSVGMRRALFPASLRRIASADVALASVEQRLPKHAEMQRRCNFPRIYSE